MNEYTLADWDRWAAVQERNGWCDKHGDPVNDLRPQWAKPQPPRGQFLGYDNDVPVFGTPGDAE